MSWRRSYRSVLARLHAEKANEKTKNEAFYAEFLKVRERIKTRRWIDHALEDAVQVDLFQNLPPLSRLDEIENQNHIPDAPESLDPNQLALGFTDTPLALRRHV